jgi:DNA-binding PadR family transcriptional regulator
MSREMSVAKLSTTSYALLGLLALRDWTAYELAQQVQYSLRYFWPRTERQLYEQPKLLVAHGLAEAHPETVGKRPRTVYRITDTGRQALRDWLAQPGQDQTFEWEGLVKVFFAENSTKEQLLAHLRDMQRAARQGVAEDVETARRRMAHFEYPQRIHLSALVGGFLMAQLNATIQWVDWAIAQVESWPDINGPTNTADLIDYVYRQMAPQPT